MLRTQPVVSNVLGVVGAAIGVVVGYYAFFWIARQGFYAMMVPGAFLGIGCSLLAQHSSQLRGAACGVAGLFAGLFTEWSFRPFIADEGLGYFLTHVQELQAVPLLMIGAGGFLAYLIGKDGGIVRLPLIGGDRGRPA